MDEEREISKLEAYRVDAIQATYELYYSPKVRDLLEKAKSEGEILTIMANARRQKFG